LDKTFRKGGALIRKSSVTREGGVGDSSKVRVLLTLIILQCEGPGAHACRKSITASGPDGCSLLKSSTFPLSAEYSKHFDAFMVARGTMVAKFLVMANVSMAKPFVVDL
jgi:hypothetical protein